VALDCSRSGAIYSIRASWTHDALQEEFPYNGERLRLHGSEALHLSNQQTVTE